MDQIFVTKYSEEHISHDKNPIIVGAIFIGYIATVIGLWVVLNKCFKLCAKQKNKDNNHLQYTPLNEINHPGYQSNNFV
jgi:hypothetical protein